MSNVKRTILFTLSLFFCSYLESQLVISKAEASCITDLPVSSSGLNISGNLTDCPDTTYTSCIDGSTSKRKVKYFRFKAPAGVFVVNARGDFENPSLANPVVEIFEGSLESQSVRCGHDNHSDSDGLFTTVNYPSSFTETIYYIAVYASKNENIGPYEINFVNCCGFSPSGLEPFCFPTTEKSPLTLSDSTKNLFCGTTDHFRAINTDASLPENTIAIDYQLNYDPRFMTPSLGDVLEGATEYGEGILKVREPGVAQVSLILDEAPQGVYFLADKPLVNINWKLRNLKADTTLEMSINNVVVSSATGFQNDFNEVTAELDIKPGASITVLNSKGDSTSKSFVFDGLDNDCDGLPEDEFISNENGTVTVPLENVSKFKLSRDIKGDHNTLKEDCETVMSYINSADKFEILNIINGSSTVSGYELLTADVNLDGAVTGADASLLTSRAINEYGCEFPQATNYNADGTPADNYTPSQDWVFIEKTKADAIAVSDIFSIPTEPVCKPLPEACSKNLYYELLLGDVDRNFSGSGALPRIDSQFAVNLDFNSAIESADGNFLVPVTVSSKVNDAFVYGLDIEIVTAGNPLDILSIESTDDVETSFSFTTNKILLQSFDYDGLNLENTVFYLKTTSVPSIELQEAVTSKFNSFVNGKTAYTQSKVINGLNDYSSAFNSTSIHPNPASGVINVEFGFNYSGNVELAVYDLTGREVTSTTNDVANASFSSIDISSLTSGNYLLKITSEDGTKSVPFVKK